MFIAVTQPVLKIMGNPPPAVCPGGAHLGCCVQCWAPEFRGRAEGAGPVNLEKRAERGPHPCTQGLRAGAKRVVPESFQWCPVTGQGAVGTKKHRTFHLNMMKNFLPVQVAEH